MALETARILGEPAKVANNFWRNMANARKHLLNPTRFSVIALYLRRNTRAAHEGPSDHAQRGAAGCWQMVGTVLTIISYKVIIV